MRLAEASQPLRSLAGVAGLALVAILTVALVPDAPAQTLSLDEAIAAALERSIALEQATIRTALARTQVDEVLDSTSPRFTLSAEPGYSLATQRGTNFASVTSVFDFPPEPTTTVTNSTGVGLSVQQPLPTSGVVSGSLGSTLSASTSIPDEGDSTTSVSFRPSLSVALSQPLFVGGRFVDADEPILVLEQARRGTAESELAVEQLRSLTAQNVTRLFLRLESLRRAIGVQESQTRLLGLQLEQARIRQEQGQGSRQEVFQLQVQINRSADARLQTRLSARALELELARLTGLRVDEQTELAGIEAVRSRLEALTGAPLLGADAEDVSPSTTDLRVAELALERARVDLAIAGKQERATATAALSLSPRYADEREDPESLVGAFSDYAGDGAGIDVAFSLGLAVPLGERERRERAVERARLSVELAERERDRVTRDLDAQRQLALARIAILEERAALLDFELEFERAQLASETELVAIGASTELAVEQIRATIASRENDIADLGTQLLLQRLDLASLSGDDLVGVLTEDWSSEGSTR